jgi:HNH endonuclease
MSRYVSETMRKEVAERAKYTCEYCRLREIDAFIKFQIEHIISLKHGGLTTLENLAYACPICNTNKGSDLATILENGRITRIYHPRKDNWYKHFEIHEGGEIVAKTNVGAASIKLLDLNNINRIIERLALIEAGVYQ